MGNARLRQAAQRLRRSNAAQGGRAMGREREAVGPLNLSVFSYQIFSDQQPLEGLLRAEAIEVHEAPAAVRSPR